MRLRRSDWSPSSSATTFGMEARRSYVDPRVCELFRNGRTIDLDGDTTREGLERATRRLLTT